MKKKKIFFVNLADTLSTAPARRPEYATTYPNSLWHEHLRGSKNKNTSVDDNVGGGQEDPDCGGRSEDAEDNQAEPVDHLNNRRHRRDCQA